MLVSICLWFIPLYQRPPPQIPSLAVFLECRLWCTVVDVLNPCLRLLVTRILNNKVYWIGLLMLWLFKLLYTYKNSFQNNYVIVKSACSLIFFLSNYAVANISVRASMELWVRICNWWVHVDITLYSNGYIKKLQEHVLLALATL